MWVSDVWAHTAKQRLTQGVESFESSTLLSGWETLTLGHRKNEKVGDLSWAPVTISTMAGAPHTALSGPSFVNKGLFSPDLLLCFLNLQSQVSPRTQNRTHSSRTHSLQCVAFGPTLCRELSGCPTTPFLCFQSASGYPARRLYDPNKPLSTMPYNGHIMSFPVIFRIVFLKSIKPFGQIAAFRVAIRETFEGQMLTMFIACV